MTRTIGHRANRTLNNSENALDSFDKDLDVVNNPLFKGLLLYMPLRRLFTVSGGVIQTQDYSPYKRIGTVSGGVTKANYTDMLDTLAFNGSSGKITVANSTDFDVTQFTVALHIKKNSTTEPADFSRSISRLIGAGGGFLCLWNQTAPRKPYFAVNDASGVGLNTANRATNMALGETRFIALTISSTQSIYYENGVNKGAVNLGITPAAGIGKPFTIGASDTAANFVNNDGISEVFFFNRVLSDTEHSALYKWVLRRL